jgi:hypothetical protein
VPGSALLELQKAVYAQLTGDATLMAKVTGVFDAVPDDQAFPYVTIGDETETGFNAFSKTGKAVVLTLHVWSQYRGFKQADEILVRINELLDGAALTVTGYTSTAMQFMSSEHLRDPDGLTRHVVARFNCLVRES